MAMDNLGKWKKPYKSGETPFTDSTDRCERMGYRPSHERIAALIAAGLSSQITHDKLFDFISKDDKELLADLPELPLIRRHLDTDLADIQQASRVYSARRREIEVRLRERYLANKAAAPPVAEPSVDKPVVTPSV